MGGKMNREFTIHRTTVTKRELRLFTRNKPHPRDSDSIRETKTTRKRASKKRIKNRRQRGKLAKRQEFLRKNLISKELQNQQPQIAPSPQFEGKLIAKTLNPQEKKRHSLTKRKITLNSHMHGVPQLLIPCFGAKFKLQFLISSNLLQSAGTGA
jgi:hypothetical protein